MSFLSFLIADKPYEIMHTILLREDTEPDKIGLYSIQVMESEEWPEGLKWREENDDPGVFVLE